MPTSEMLEAAMKARSEIKNGDTRASLADKWEPDGGLQFIPETRYVFKECPLLQVTMQFKVVSEQAWSDSDTVTSVSRVYVEYGAKD
jgi:hypothetical protein